MACRTIGGYPFSFVALDAKLHIDRDMRLRKRKGHVVYVTVAILAGDLSQRHMSPVREIGVVGHAVHLHPRDRLIAFDVADQFFLFLAVRHRFFMAVPAIVNVGNRGFFVRLHPGVTIETTKFHVLYMLFMIISNGLGNAFRIRTTAEYQKKGWENDKSPDLHPASIPWEHIQDVGEDVLA